MTDRNSMMASFDAMVEKQDKDPILAAEEAREEHAANMARRAAEAHKPVTPEEYEVMKRQISKERPHLFHAQNEKVEGPGRRSGGATSEQDHDALAVDQVR